MTRWLMVCALLIAAPSFAQEPAPPAEAAPVAPVLTADEQVTIDNAKAKQIEAEALVMQTKAYKEFAAAQQRLQQAQLVVKAKQKAMLDALQETTEYKTMIALRQSVEARLKKRGEKHIIDWRTGTLQPPPVARK